MRSLIAASILMIASPTAAFTLEGDPINKVTALGRVATAACERPHAINPQAMGFLMVAAAMIPSDLVPDPIKVSGYEKDLREGIDSKVAICRAAAAAGMDWEGKRIPLFIIR